MLNRLRGWLYDFVPYSVESWIGLIGDYNRSIWPLQWVFAAGFIALILLQFRVTSGRFKFELLILGIYWIWCGAIFQLQFFSILNWAAGYYGWMFILQGVLLVVYASLGNSIASDKPKKELFVSIALLLGFMILLPLLQLAAGHTVFELGWFGTTPTGLVVVSTVVMLRNSLSRWWIWVIPACWALIAFANGWPLGYIPDLVLFPIVIICFLLKIYYKPETVIIER